METECADRSVRHCLLSPSTSHLMATATVGAVQHTPTSRIQQDAESTALKTVHFDSMEKDAVTASVSEKSSERFLPPIEDKKAAKESNNKVAHSFAECVPQELLLALKRQTAPTGTRRSPNKGTLQPVATARPTTLHPPANAWNHAKQRAKFKHLTDSAPCVCGAGRDISFLYDVSKQKESSSQRGDQATLIPSEFHIVQHSGVHGTEFKDERYTTRLEEHQKHTTTFPSLKPSSRSEVLALKQAFETMMEKAGVGVSKVGENPDRQPQNGPTQLHHLLELVREEQNIFNIVFHEIIRQVSVHCVERGELLAQVRNRYSDLLSRVPLEMKSLHDELLAQRALDRRLTEELTSFKEQVELVTQELAEVKDHDLHLTEQIGEDKKLLLEALEASQKNSSVLQEYHELYDLQRKRLESRIGDLKREKDLWQQAAYKLANKVTDSQDLRTVWRQQVCERSWHSLAQHFAILLSDRDSEQLLGVQEHVLAWKEAVTEFTESQQSLETQLHTELQNIEGGIEHWRRTLGNHLGGKNSGSTEPLSTSEFHSLTEDIQQWDTSLSKHYAKFAGDILLRRQEKLQRLSEEVEAWTDEAVGIFHRLSATKSDPAQPQEHTTMVELNTRVYHYHEQLGDRVAGEGGVASGLMHASTPLETWSNKLCLAAQSGDQRMGESEWIKLHSDLKTWANQLSEVMEVLPGDKDDKSGLSELLTSADRWIKALANVTNSKNAQIMDEANSLHTALTQWTVEFLLYLTRVAEDEEFELMLGGLGERQTQTGLRSTSQHISDRMKQFTAKLSQCCGDVAHEIAAKGQRQTVDNEEGKTSGSDHEVKDLKRMEVECVEWVRTVQLLLQDTLEGGTLDSQRTGSSKQEGVGSAEEGVASSTSGNMQARSNGCLAPCDPLKGEGASPDEVFVLGVDSNVYRRSLVDLGNMPNDEEFTASSAATLGLPTVDDMPSLSADAMPKPEDLMMELDSVEKKLKLAEEATQSAEVRASRAEQELALALQRVSEMERELEGAQELQKELAAQQGGKSSARQKKGTNKGSTTQLLNAKKKGDCKLATKTLQ